MTPQASAETPTVGTNGTLEDLPISKRFDKSVVMFPFFGYVLDDFSLLLFENTYLGGAVRVFGGHNHGNNLHKLGYTQPLCITMVIF